MTLLVIVCALALLLALDVHHQRVKQHRALHRKDDA